VTEGDGWLGAFRGALGFLTVAGGPAAPAPAATAWFPLVGLLAGCTIGLVWWAAASVFPPAVAAGLAVAADLALTGMLHLDGLADSADGLLPPLPRDRRLAVMRSPEVGAFGVAAVVTTLGLRWAALAALVPPGGDPSASRLFLLGGLWAASRALMAGTLLLLPYARVEGGLAARFRSGADGPAVPGLAVLLPGIVLAAVACGIGLGAPGLVALLAGLLAAAGVVLLALRRLGGFTGDVLGAAGMLCETAGLVVATLWR
jgi:adenosylcobinamide-GDP ribazoletransferase